MILFNNWKKSMYIRNLSITTLEFCSELIECENFDTNILHFS